MYKYYKYKNFYLIGIFILFLVTILIVAKTQEFRIETIKYESISKTIKDYQYSLIHIGQLDENDKKIMDQMQKNFDAEIYNVDSAEDYDESIEYLAYVKDKLVGTIEADKTSEEVENYLKKYYLNLLPDNEVLFINAETFDEVNKVTNKDKLSIIVFGALDCSYCSLYKPVINEIVDKYGLDIYYIEKNVMEESEYQAIRDIDFAVPAKCTTSGSATSTKESIATPLTLIVKNNKTVDCILGYVTEEELTELLKTNKLVK